MQFRFIGKDRAYHGALNGQLGTIVDDKAYYDSPAYVTFHPEGWRVLPEGPVCAIVRRDALEAL